MVKEYILKRAYEEIADKGYIAYCRNLNNTFIDKLAREIVGELARYEYIQNFNYNYKLESTQELIYRILVKECEHISALDPTLRFYFFNSTDTLDFKDVNELEEYFNIAD